MMRTDGGASEQATGYLATVLSEARQRLDSGDADGAASQLEDSLAQARGALAFGPQGVLLCALGDLHRVGGRMDAACAHYEQAAAALHEAGDTAAEADALLRRGDAQRALQRIGAAAQAYAAAAALYDTLDDPRGTAHGEFLLAGLADASHKDIAEEHYARAVELYTEAAKRQGDGAPRRDEVAPPDSVADPRLVDSAIMAVVAQRAAARLHAAPVPAEALPPARPVASAIAAASAGASASPVARPPAPPAPAAAPADRLGAGLLLGAVALGFCGMTLLAVRWTGHGLAVTMLAAVLAAGVMQALVHQPRVASPYLKYGAAAVAGLLLLASGALPSLQQPPDVAPPGLPSGSSVAPAGAAPSSPETRRAEFERDLAGQEAAGAARATADLLRRYGEFERAEAERQHCLALLARSYDLYRSSGAAQPAAQVAAMMGDVLLGTQRPEPARQRYDDAVGLYRELRDAPGYSDALRKRGDAEARLQRWSDAHASYSEALALMRQRRAVNVELALTLRLAAAEQALARPHLARPLLERALRLSNTSGTPMQARVWLAVAEFEASLDREGPALRAYERAVTLAGAARDGNLEARGLRQRGDYERRRGKLAAAGGSYEVAIRAAHAREAWSAEARSRVRAAELAIQMGELQTASEQYASAQALYEQQPHSYGAARVALGRGDLAGRLGQVEVALSSYAQALELATQADHVGLQIEALDRLTPLLASSNPQAADEYVQRAAALRGEAFGAAPAPPPAA